jgi:hypothetical protein
MSIYVHINTEKNALGKAHEWEMNDAKFQCAIKSFVADDFKIDYERFATERANFVVVCGGFREKSLDFGATFLRYRC